MAYPPEWKTAFTTKNGKAVSFRPERDSDTEMLWAMFSTLSESSILNLVPPFTRKRVESWTSNIDYNEALAIIAVVKEEKMKRIVGSASLKFNSQEVFRHKAELGLTVHDDYQNLGIGTALLNHMLFIAKMKNLKKVWLIVNTQNNRAIQLYKKAGFRVEGTLRKEMHFKGRYSDEYRMAIFL